MFVDYDHLPEGEIKEYITDTFPNKPKKEALSKMIFLTTPLRTQCYRKKNSSTYSPSYRRW